MRNENYCLVETLLWIFKMYIFIFYPCFWWSLCLSVSSCSGEEVKLPWVTLMSCCPGTSVACYYLQINQCNIVGHYFYFTSNLLEISDYSHNICDCNSSSLPTIAKEHIILSCPMFRLSSSIWPSMWSFRWNGKPSISSLFSSIKSFKLWGKQTVITVSEGRRSNLVFFWNVCIRYKLNTQSDLESVKWTDNGHMYSESSHPNISIVREDIRFSLQPVSISTFTSCPKHCKHTDSPGLSGCGWKETQKKQKPFIRAKLSSFQPQRKLQFKKIRYKRGTNIWNNLETDIKL